MDLRLGLVMIGAAAWTAGLAIGRPTIWPRGVLALAGLALLLVIGRLRVNALGGRYVAAWRVFVLALAGVCIALSLS